MYEAAIPILRQIRAPPYVMTGMVEEGEGNPRKNTRLEPTQ
jgi:hypothetical protein